MNSELSQLQTYPFQKLSAMLEQVSAAENLLHIPMQIGEPKHTPPAFVADAIDKHIGEFGSYPSTRGLSELRQAQATWATHRFELPAGSLNADSQVLPVNGTREALFSFTQAVIDRQARLKPIVVMPNPFYQIYEGAALLAGAEPWYLPQQRGIEALPDLNAVPEEVWARCQLLVLCSPDNPTGSVLGRELWIQALALADEFDFVVAADECYSELYRYEDQPPFGLLQICAQTGRLDFRRCVVFHSLSKRSNLPGLRSGFIAGDASLLEPYFLYRTYHGSAMSLPTQRVSILAWQDEQHVIENRELYRRKFAAVVPVLEEVLPTHWPDGGFYLWLETPIDDREFTRRLYQQWQVTVLPGQFISRQTVYGDPGQNHVRIALVGEPERCLEAAQRIHAFCQTLR